MTVGEPDAQEDKDKLRKCFVDTGDLDELRNCLSSKSIVLGRTGVGKTALLSMLEYSENNVTVLSADDLAVDYLSNNVALSSYLEMGIDLDLFFRVLWRHILVTELVNLVGAETGERGMNYFLQSILNTVYQKPYQKKGQAYLAKYPDFWQNVEVRVKEEVNSFSKELDGRIEGKFGKDFFGSEAGIHANSTLSHEERSQIEQIGKEVVKRGQIRELSNLTKLLADELKRNKQNRYFIALDRLDERWTNDELRYKLIRALIEAMRELNDTIDQLKVICAIREDLLDRVFKNTRSDGDQQEKYGALSLKLYWTDSQLLEVLEERINQLFVNHYGSGQSISVEDILTEKVRERDPVSYIVSRTLSTPRDVIMFLNECIEQAEGKSRINQIHLTRAEGRYSVSRLQALADEWSADYPTLGEAAFLLKRFNKEFTIESLDEESFIDRIVEYVGNAQKHTKGDGVFELLNHYSDFVETMARLFLIFYRIGLVGIYIEDFYETYWSHKGNKISASDISGSTKLHIHPAFYRVLSVSF